MKGYWAKLSGNRLLKNLSIVFSENIITKALNFLVITLLSVHLGPSDYGKYSYIFVNAAFCSALFDFGMENTAVRFSSKNKEKLLPIFGLYFLVKAAICTAVAAAIYLFKGPLFDLVHQPDIVPYVYYFILSFLGESLLFVNDTYLQAIQRFKLRALINISRYVIAVSAILLFYLNHSLSLDVVLWLYYLPVLLSCLFLWNYAGFIRAFFREGVRGGLLKEILHYEKWMVMVSVPNNTLGRIDFLLISLWVTFDQIGIYNVAFQLSAVVSFLPYVLSKVMLPAFSELSEENVVAFTKRMMKPNFIIAGLMTLIIPLSGPVITLLLGDKYEPAIPILELMLAAAIVAFLLIPIEQALYSLGKPNYIMIGKYVQIAVIVALIVATVPYFGTVWAAVSVLAARILYGAILYKLYLSYAKTITARSAAAV